QALVYHLPDDFFATYIQRIESVTAADVQRVAQKYIDPEHFAVVIAGDRAAIEPGIRALNAGPIKILTVAAVSGPAPNITKYFRYLNLPKQGGGSSTSRPRSEIVSACPKTGMRPAVHLASLESP